MNQQDLKRLGRRDLLEMLLDLSKENEQLRKRNSMLEKQLVDRMLTVSNVGSLAEAAMQLNGVFQAAEAACDQYVYNVQQRCRQMEENTLNKCMQITGESAQQLESYEKEVSE